MSCSPLTGRKALAFYGELFGWQKPDAHVGSMGTYQQFSAGAETIGAHCIGPMRLLRLAAI
jgi:predicted enzyme related to lactoylglutathione lyase